MHNLAVHFVYGEQAIVDMLELAAFGEILKALRKQKKVSQQVLADRLGVHRNTIGMWERGDYLPDSRGMVLELARQLHLDEQETKKLLEASLTALPTRWHVPYQRNPFFTGRTQTLQQLHALLHEQAAEHVHSYALQGLGGLGKTQTAVEYAYRHYQDYSALFWVTADSSDSLLASYTAIAERLQLNKHPEQLIATVMRWFDTHSGWLLIYDNVEDIGLVKRFLPAARRGALLMTTRLQALGGLAQGIELAPLSDVEGLQLLLRRSNYHDTLSHVMHSEYHTAQSITDLLDGLPLALDQAGAYIEETRCSLSDFLRLLEQQPLTLLQERADFADHPQSVVKTFSLTFAQLQRTNPLAADLLTMCAFLAPTAISEQLLLQYINADTSPATNPLRFNATLKSLLTYSLVQRDPRTETLNLHRLVSTLLKESMSAEARHNWLLDTAVHLEQSFPLDFTLGDYWRCCAQLLPHTLYCLEQAQQWGGALLPIARLATKSAWYLYVRARADEAEQLWLYALWLYENLNEASADDRVYALSGLAMLYVTQGRYRQAKERFQQVAALRQQMDSAADHACLSYSLHGEALLYQELGQYAKAEALFHEAIALRQKLHGDNHPWIGILLHDMAQLYSIQGCYQEAERCLQDAIAIWEQVGNGEHAYLAICLSGLANIYYKQGRFQKAAPLTQRVQAMQQYSRVLSRPYTAY